jgi:hypothetical protein
MPSEAHRKSKQPVVLDYAPPAPSQKLRKGTMAAVIAQMLVAAFIVAAPFGFDKPSAWGLDFDDFQKAMLLYGMLLLGGIVLAVACRWWGVIVLQILFPCAVLLLRYMHVLHI